MLSKVRWRIAIPFLALVLVLTGGLAIYYSRSTCVATAGCVLTTTLVVGGLAIVAVVALAWLISERTIRPVREVTEVAQRIVAGDRNARVLLSRRDEVGDLVVAFNRLTESYRDEIDTLVEEHQQFATVLKHMADGVLITDDRSYVGLINPAACRLLDTTEQEALGRSFATIVRHHQLIDLWHRCQAEGVEQVDTVEFDRNLFLQAVVTPFQQEDTTGFLVILQDLTQVRRLQTMRRDFISNLSHELRSPLASLRAVVETLADGALDDRPAAERFLEQAGREVEVMTRMVDELTELSQIESGQIRLNLSAVAVADLISLPLERLHPLAEQKQIEIVVDVPADLPLVLVDPQRVQQVITNLLHNAIKFSADGDTVVVAGSRYVKDGSTETEVLVEVRDNGIGIPKQDLPRIFERFYKTDRARTRSEGGTGLGLAIARHIVQAHGGRIWATSKEGKGSTFYFTLPAAPEELPAIP